MKLAINIDMDNAAFEDDWTLETMWILRNILKDHIFRFPSDPECTVTLGLQDQNGNRVGSVAVSP